MQYAHVTLEHQSDGVGSDFSSKAVSDNIGAVGKTAREPHKMSYVIAAKRVME